MKPRYFCIAILAFLLLGCKTPTQQPFTKLVFHTGMCFGTCPVYHLEIKNDKSVRLYVECIFKPNAKNMFAEDTTREGYFTGMANDTSFRKLSQAVEQVKLDDLKFDGAHCCDGSMITIIAYYNGKKKILRSMFPPEKAEKLIEALYEICQKSALKKSDKFEIEDVKN